MTPDRPTIGRLRDRVRVEVPAAVADALGQSKPQWVPVCSVWAEVRPLTAREIWQARGAQADATEVVRVRRRTDVLAAGTKARVVVVSDGGRVLNVEGVQSPVDGGREWLVLLCRTGERKA